MSLRGIRERNPEPAGGYLKSQSLDPEVAARMGIKERKEDEKLADLQRAVLQGICPLVNILERCAAILKADELNSDELPREFRKVARVHVAGSIRLERQKHCAKSASLPERIVTADKIGKEEVSLFGKEFIDKIRAIEDAKVRQVFLQPAKPPQHQHHGNGNGYRPSFWGNGLSRGRPFARGRGQSFYRRPENPQPTNKPPQ